MKEIPIEDVSTLSSELYEAAVRVGCTHVSLTGRIWPGGQLSGPPEQAARFFEFSWLKAALLDTRIIFEESDPAAYTQLLQSYGLGDEPPAAAGTVAAAPAVQQTSHSPVKLELTVQIQPGTLTELHQRATARKLGIGEFLDEHFTPRPSLP